MKWLFYLIVILYMIFRAVYGVSHNGLIVENDDKSTTWRAGTRREIVCKGTNKNQKVHWEDPSGQAIDRRHANSRVYVQERMTQRSVSPTLVLVITHLLVDDTGIWTCRSGNNFETASICVVDKATFVNTPLEVTVDRGGAITLTCEARGNPEPRLVWHRKGEIITDNDINGNSKYKLMVKYNIQGYDGLLTILSLKAEDAGVYTCEAIQEFPNHEFCVHNESLDIHLVVNYAPTITHDINDTILIFCGNNTIVHIPCFIDGHPIPTYHWYQQYPQHDKDIPETMISMRNSTSILTVEVNESTFYDTYLCRATNPYGEAWNLYKLIPKVAPQAPEELIVVNTTDNSITLNAKWDTSAMDVSITRFETMYIKKASLHNGRPRKNSDWTKAEISILELGNETLSVNGSSVRELEERDITLEGFDADTEYWLRSRAINDVGSSKWSISVLATTASAPNDEIEESVDVEIEEQSIELILTELVLSGAVVGIILLVSYVIKKM